MILTWMETPAADSTAFIARVKTAGRSPPMPACGAAAAAALQLHLPLSVCATGPASSSAAQRNRVRRQRERSCEQCGKVEWKVGGWLGKRGGGAGVGVLLRGGGRSACGLACKRQRQGVALQADGDVAWGIVMRWRRRKAAAFRIGWQTSIVTFPERLQAYNTEVI